MASALTSEIYRGLLGDQEIAAALSAEAEIRAMLDVEAALVRAQGKLGIIPPRAALDIDTIARGLKIAPDDLAASTAVNGVPVIGLVSALRGAVSAEAAHYVHWGATSQDIMDTALVLNLRMVLEILENRLRALVGQLSAMARLHRDTVMAGRTRSQQAVPTTFGLKMCAWIAPLLRHGERLQDLRRRLLVAQLGGAAGTLAPFGDQGISLAEAFAGELDLAPPLMPWHSQRDTMLELAGWFAGVSASLGKAGSDLVLLAQTEVGEVWFEGGGSSTMPQKANPVAAEQLVALARYSGGQLGVMQAAAVHSHERDSTAWELEWLALPPLAEAAGAGLRHAAMICETLDVCAGRMAENLNLGSGAIMAEAASFALSAHMPRPDAKELVARGCVDCIASGQALTGWLSENADVDVDWEAVGDPSNWLGSAREMVERVCDHADHFSGS